MRNAKKMTDCHGWGYKPWAIKHESKKHGSAQLGDQFLKLKAEIKLKTWIHFNPFMYVIWYGPVRSVQVDYCLFNTLFKMWIVFSFSSLSHISIVYSRNHLSTLVGWTSQHSLHQMLQFNSVRFHSHQASYLTSRIICIHISNHSISLRCIFSLFIAFLMLRKLSEKSGKSLFFFGIFICRDWNMSARNQILYLFIYLYIHA